MKKIFIFDTTLRDGAQAEGVSFSVEDKLKITLALDRLGVDFIEGGNPSSNPKDIKYFEMLKNVELKNAKPVVFASTRRKGVSVQNDKALLAAIETGVEYVSIFGKCWDYHVTEILGTTPDENLRMIAESISFLRENGKKVIFDAEHFFDGYKENPAYAMQALEAAFKAGAIWLCLCDTNGGCFPDEIRLIVEKVKAGLGGVNIGIHAHNDCGMAVACSVEAVNSGAAMVQGTFTGFGERCGNANLSTIIPNLQVKRNFSCIPEDNLREITQVARFINETSNLNLSEREPYVGKGAFSHKGGMHIDGVKKSSKSYEHIEPERVGNIRRLLASEVAGRAMVLDMVGRLFPEISKESPGIEMVVETLKKKEFEGYQFEGASASLEILIRKALGKHSTFFEIENYKMVDEYPSVIKNNGASVMIKVNVDGKSEITAAEGDGPVNALDKALRKALEVFYPALSKVRLVDYKVRVLESQSATASKVRVLIESSDGADNHSWTTVGVSEDIIEASRIALIDSIEYKLIKDREG